MQMWNRLIAFENLMWQDRGAVGSRKMWGRKIRPTKRLDDFSAPHFSASGAA
jgi:hypothetical protein